MCQPDSICNAQVNDSLKNPKEAFPLKGFLLKGEQLLCLGNLKRKKKKAKCHRHFEVTASKIPVNK